jgi:hypothetical protein
VRREGNEDITVVMNIIIAATMTVQVDQPNKVYGHHKTTSQSDRIALLHHNYVQQRRCR